MVRHLVANLRTKDFFSSPYSHSSELLGFYHIVKGCISRGREPRVISNTGELACDNHSSTLKVANLHHEVKLYYISLMQKKHDINQKIPLFLPNYEECKLAPMNLKINSG